MMPFLVDLALAEKSGRGSAQRLRARVRASVRLEVLETRCLMSGSQARFALQGDVAPTIRSRPVTSQLIGSHDVDSLRTTQKLNRDRSQTESAPGQGDRISSQPADRSTYN